MDERFAYPVSSCAAIFLSASMMETHCNEAHGSQKGQENPTTLGDFYRCVTITERYKKIIVIIRKSGGSKRKSSESLSHAELCCLAQEFIK